MEGVVEDLRAKLRAGGAGTAPRDLPEARLELACAWGSGHVLVTGADRREVDGLLDRVIRKIDPMGTVRAHAGDPGSTVDRLIALLDSEQEVTGHLDRRKALLQLLARAQEQRKSIFVVVDDADKASVEQLERLRTTLEVAPDAIERLRMVLIGDASLPAKLDSSAARALSSRITSRIRVGEAELGAQALRSGSEAMSASRASTWGFAAAAAVSFAVISYATVLLLSAPKITFDHVDDVASSAPTTRFRATEALAPVKGWRPLTGKEAYLDSPLEIPADPRWVTGSALFAPPAAEAVAPPVGDAAAPTGLAAASPPPAAAQPPALKSKNPTRQRAVSSIDALASLMAKRAKPAAPVRQAAPKQVVAPAGSSLATLRSHFK